MTDHVLPHAPSRLARAARPVVWVAMPLLAELSLSAAFPMTAIGYVLVIGLGWTVFHEPVSALQIIGGAAILAGVGLLSQDGSA